jgi:hypothetical protein
MTTKIISFPAAKTQAQIPVQLSNVLVEPASERRNFVEGVIVKVEHGEALVKFPNGEERWFSNEQATMLVGAKCQVEITAGRLHLEQQARAALTAHYARKGLKAGELTQTVDKVMATQFKPCPLPEVSYEK